MGGAIECPLCGNNQAYCKCTRLEKSQFLEIARLRKWTPVAEGQPAPDVEVLGWNPDDKVRTWLIATGVTVFGVAWSNWQPTDTEDQMRVREPTHWRPLPSPPASA